MLHCCFSNWVVIVMFLYWWFSETGCSSICKEMVSAKQWLMNGKTIQQVTVLHTESWVRSLYLAALVHASETSKLDYCNSLYVGLSSRMVQKLQLVQNAVAPMVTEAKRFDSVGPLLQQLHWLSIHFHSQFKMMVLTFKTLHNLHLPYLIRSSLGPLKGLSS